MINGRITNPDEVLESYKKEINIRVRKSAIKAALLKLLPNNQRVQHFMDLLDKEMAAVH